MKFSVIHPTARVTADFEHPWWKAAMSVLQGCDSPRDLEYVLVVHHSRIAAFWASEAIGAFSPYVGRFSVIVNYDRDCLVDQCNAGLLAASNDIHVWNQDDMRFPEHWDSEILQLIPDASQRVCVKARTDGDRDELLTLPTIATKALAQFIGPLSPEYISMYSDDEWSARARQAGEVIHAPHLYFEHLHPTNETARVDSIYTQENSHEAYKVGKAVYESRRKQGFPYVELPGWPKVETPNAEMGLVDRAADWIAAKLGAKKSDSKAPPILAICTPGDSFPFVWNEAFLNLGARLGDEGYLCKRYMGYSSNVYHCRIDLASRVIEEAEKTGERPDLVLWLDSDNVLLPDQLSGLLRFMDRYPAVDGIFGWCWIRKAHGWTTSAGMFWPDDGVHVMSMNMDAMFAGKDGRKFAPKRIEHSGFPCALLRYSAFEKLGAGAFRPMTKADLPAYFEGNMPVKEVSDDWFSGEDTSWCLQAKKAGLTLVVDPGCKVGHLKLQFQEPDIGKITESTPQAAKEWRAGLNGHPIDVPREYEKVMT